MTHATFFVCSLAVVLTSTSTTTHAQTSQRLTAEWHAVEDRQFDFWMGEWDVVLRVR
jgi:hypothetical protein